MHRNRNARFNVANQSPFPSPQAGESPTKIISEIWVRHFFMHARGLLAAKYR